jgi:hypothetical protein
MAVLQSLCVRFPCVADAAVRALADRRRLTARVGLGDHGPAAAPGAVVTCPRGHVPGGSGRPLHASPGVANRVARRAARGRFARIRVDGRWPGWHARGCRGGRGLGVRRRGRVVANAVTVRDSKRFAGPLVCPDPVRHMSVISGSAERTAACCGGLRRRLERGADADPVDLLTGQHGINERDTGR